MYKKTHLYRGVSFFVPACTASIPIFVLKSLNNKMEKTKLYKTMTADEQLKWITAFTNFNREKIPILCALGDAWETSHFKMFEEGLRLLSAFSFCRNYVDKSMMFGDYSRRLNRMKYYIELIKKEIAKGAVIQVDKGKTLAYVPSVTVGRKRGRPSNAEKNAQAALVNNSVEQEKKLAIARLMGSMVVSSAEVSHSNEKPLESVQESELAKTVEEKSSSDSFAQAIDESQGPARLHLDQLSWLMTDALAAEVKKIQGYRAMAAKESEQAKALAENGVAQEIIAPHTQEAVKYTELYQQIYRQIDEELASLYAGICIVSDYRGVLRKAEEKSLDENALKGLLKPYYDKLNVDGWGEAIKKQIAEELSLLSNGQSNKEQVNTEHKKERLHAIRTYMLRKDIALTPGRIEKMKDMLKEVQNYGESTDEYEAVIEAAENALLVKAENQEEKED